MSKELETSWRHAFEFVQKFYLETSYLIKEVEGQLGKETENFVLCRGSGYAATAYTSSGLDPKRVCCWFPATLTVAFVPAACTKETKGYTETPFTNSLRPLILHIEAYWSEMERPIVYSGILNQITSKKKNTKKFEKLMWEFAYHPDEIFIKAPKIDYENIYCNIKGQVSSTSLFSLNSAQDVKEKIVEPMLKLYRKGALLPI